MLRFCKKLTPLWIAIVAEVFIVGVIFISLAKQKETEIKSTAKKDDWSDLTVFENLAKTAIEEEYGVQVANIPLVDFELTDDKLKLWLIEILEINGVRKTYGTYCFIAFQNVNLENSTGEIVELIVDVTSVPPCAEPFIATSKELFSNVFQNPIPEEYVQKIYFRKAMGTLSDSIIIVWSASDTIENSSFIPYCYSVCFVSNDGELSNAKLDSLEFQPEEVNPRGVVQYTDEEILILQQKAECLATSLDPGYCIYTGRYFIPNLNGDISFYFELPNNESERRYLLSQVNMYENKWNLSYMETF